LATKLKGRENTGKEGGAVEVGKEETSRVSCHRKGQKLGEGPRLISKETNKTNTYGKGQSRKRRQGETLRKKRRKPNRRSNFKRNEKGPAPTSKIKTVRAEMPAGRIRGTRV